MYFIKCYRRGIKNKYIKGMPLIEIINKDILFQLKEIKNWIINNFTNHTILCYPHFPSRGSTIYKIANELNYNITNKLTRRYQLAIYFEYNTERNEFQELEKLKDKIKVINLFSRTISKIHVDSIFLETFGYSTIIDPLKYKGKAVRKSDTNALHDGIVIDCPIDVKQDGFIYQKLIDNSFNTDQVLDIRVPVINYKIPFVYLKYRYKYERFKNTTIITDLVKDITSVLNNEEIDKIIQFCKKDQLEFVELDVLRDNDDKKIYIVDVNNTPQGPPKNTNKEDSIFALKTMAKYFKESFIN